MESTDREIIIAIQVEQTEQGKRITRIESRLDSMDKRIDRIESRQAEQTAIIMDIDKRLYALESNFDTLKWGIGIGFGVMAALIGLSTLIITALPFLRSRRENPPATNDNAPALIQSIIDLLRYTRESEKH